MRNLPNWLAEFAEARQACAADVKKPCADVKPGRDGIVACIRPLSSTSTMAARKLWPEPLRAGGNFPEQAERMSQ